MQKSALNTGAIATENGRLATGYCRLATGNRQCRAGAPGAAGTKILPAGLMPIDSKGLLCADSPQ
jgi:hypothetical protein